MPTNLWYFQAASCFWMSSAARSASAQTILSVRSPHFPQAFWSFGWRAVSSHQVGDASIIFSQHKMRLM